jgi:hypothetical protein
MGGNAKPNPKHCNAWFRDTSTLVFCCGSVAADAALVARLQEEPRMRRRTQCRPVEQGGAEFVCGIR